jgi:hypothetical protein
MKTMEWMWAHQVMMGQGGNGEGQSIAGEVKRDINSQRATLSGRCVCGRESEETEDVHALIAALLWDSVEFLLKCPCQGCETEDIDRYTILHGSAKVKLTDIKYIDAHLVASPRPARIKSLCGFELVWVKGSIEIQDVVLGPPSFCDSELLVGLCRVKLASTQETSVIGSDLKRNLITRNLRKPYRRVASS